jgi:hypothetical protein
MIVPGIGLIQRTYDSLRPTAYNISGSCTTTHTKLKQADFDNYLFISAGCKMTKWFVGITIYKTSYD